MAPPLPIRPRPDKVRRSDRSSCAGVSSMILPTSVTVGELSDQVVESGRSLLKQLGPVDEPRRNVGKAERIATAVAGGAITVLGLRARSLPGVLAAAAGIALVHRGV